MHIHKGQMLLGEPDSPSSYISGRHEAAVLRCSELPKDPECVGQTSRPNNKAITNSLGI